MFSRRFLFVVLLLAGAVGFAGAEESQWLQYRFSQQAQEIVEGIGGRGIELIKDKPEGVEWPKFKSEKLVFAKWVSPMVNGGFAWVALDSKGDDGQFDLLYIDSNGDGKLSDETAITPYRTENNYTYFGPAKVIFQYEGEPVTYHLNFRFYNYQDNRRFTVIGGCWYEGSIIVAGEKKRCVLADYDVNGTFDDKNSNFYDSDRIRVGEGVGWESLQYVGNYIELGEKLYRLEVARDGAYVKLTSAEDVKFGEVSMPECITGFAVGGENGSFVRKMEKGLAKLPVGKYRIDYWTINRKDEKGNDWRLKGCRFGDKGIFEISDTGQTKLAIGEPAFCKLSGKMENGKYNFIQELRGSLDESIELTCNSSKAGSPKMHIKSEDGSYDRKFTLEYG